RREVADNVAVRARWRGSRGDAGRSASAVIADRIDDRSREASACWIEDGAVAGDVTIVVGVGAGKRRDRLAGLCEVRSAPFPSIGDRANKSVIVVECREVVHPGDRELMRQIKRGTSAFVGEVEA